MARRKAKAPEVPVWYVVVDTDSYCTVTREATEDQWDADDLEYSISVKGIHLAEEGKYHDFPVAFEPKEGITYYLVAVTYDTGDSFHREDGKKEFVSLFETKASAQKCAQAIIDHYRRYREDKARSWEVEVPLAGGTVKFHAPWCGYFERMQEVEVIPVSISGYEKFRPYD